MCRPLTAEEVEALCVRLETYAQGMRAGIPMVKSAREEIASCLVAIACYVRMGGISPDILGDGAHSEDC